MTLYSKLPSSLLSVHNASLDGRREIVIGERVCNGGGESIMTGRIYNRLCTELNSSGGDFCTSTESPGEGETLYLYGSSGGRHFKGAVL